MSRGLLILLALLAAAGSSWAAYHWFRPAMDFVCVGTLPQLVRIHGDASRLAQAGFAMAAGLAGASVPMAALIGLGFAKKGRYARLLPPALLVMVLSLVAAALVYRHDMQSIGSRAGELIQLYRDSKRELLLNPLTRCALISAASTLGYGLFEGILNAFRR